MQRPIMALVVGASLALAVGVGGGAAFTGTPSGERVHGQSTLEPVYNAENAGELGVISTPNKAPMNANPHAWSPIYVPVYPVGSTALSSTGSTAYLCRHLLADNKTVSDNCPDHGPGIAGLAQTCPAAIPVCSQAIRDVYAGGVAGHDHVMDFPGGADFNVPWEPVIVLFTSTAAANEHLLTDTQIADAVTRGDAVEIANPDATFHCAKVSNRIWDLGTPVAPFTG
jgi:hypothetical protein